jgi:hypothetical protein
MAGVRLPDAEGGFSMSMLPPADLIPGPEMMSVGFSLADMAVAETGPELEGAKARFEELADRVRGSFRELGEISEGMEEAAVDAPFAILRTLLEKLLSAERSLQVADNSFTALLVKERVKSNFTRFGLDGYAGIRRFATDIVNDFAPLVRELRLRLICVIAERASAAGVDVIAVSDEFRRMFRQAHLEETTGWQETAYLLANVEAARILAASIDEAGLDPAERLSVPPSDRPAPV